ncbi:hypothetical protein MVEG_07533 [Podila verticillata NRRL 6337]|nr:hypothetical protein MVEG_07533 [Podila verticillata NRRL 6337]
MTFDAFLCLDKNFSQSHTIVTTKILPKISAYSESSASIIEHIQLWHNFFAEAATPRPPQSARGHPLTIAEDDSLTDDKDGQRQEMFSSPDLHISPSARALMRRRQQARLQQRQRSNDSNTPTGRRGGYESIVLSENTLSPTFLQECSSLGSLQFPLTPVPAMQRTASKRIATPLGERASLLRLRQIQAQRAESTSYPSAAVDKENVDPSNCPTASFSLPIVVTPTQLVYMSKFRGKHPDPRVHTRTERRALEPKSPHINSYFNIDQGSTSFMCEGNGQGGAGSATDHLTKERDADRSSAWASGDSLRIINLDPTQRYSPATTRKRSRDDGEVNGQELPQPNSRLETRKDSSNRHQDSMVTRVVDNSLQTYEQDYAPTDPLRRLRAHDPRFDNPIVAKLVTPEEHRVPGFRSRKSMFTLSTVLDEDTLTMPLPITTKTARSHSEPTLGVSTRG